MQARSAFEECSHDDVLYTETKPRKFMEKPNLRTFVSKIREQVLLSLFFISDFKVYVNNAYSLATWLLSYGGDTVQKIPRNRFAMVERFCTNLGEQRFHQRKWQQSKHSKQFYEHLRGTLMIKYLSCYGTSILPLIFLPSHKKVKSRFQ